LNPISPIELLVLHQKLVFVIKLLGFYDIMCDWLGVDQNGFSFLCVFLRNHLLWILARAWHYKWRAFNLQNKINLLGACVLTKFLDICGKICADNVIIRPTKFFGGSKLCQESSACSDISAIFSQVIQVSATPDRPISNRIHFWVSLGKFYYQSSHFYACQSCCWLLLVPLRSSGEGHSIELSF